MKDGPDRTESGNIAATSSREADVSNGVWSIELRFRRYRIDMYADCANAYYRRQQANGDE